MVVCCWYEIIEFFCEISLFFVEVFVLVMYIGVFIGVILCFVMVYLIIYNKVVDGLYKCFIDFEDEKIFVDYNIKGILVYKCVVDVLLKI